jgi:hypothetical protein
MDNFFSFAELFDDLTKKNELSWNSQAKQEGHVRGPNMQDYEIEMA